MSKITLNDVASGADVSVMNSNFQKIEDTLNDQVLFRSNPTVEPNSLENAVDCNNQRLYNLPAPQSLTEPLRLKDLTDIAAGDVNNASNVLVADAGGYLVSNNVEGALQELAIAIGAGSASSIINVKEYGAVGDGVTNDTAAIQTALNSSSGERVYFPRGTYLITSQLSVNSNIELFGDGSSSIIKLGAANISGIYTTGKTNVIVRSLKFLNTNTSVTAYTGGVNFYNSSYCKVIDCEFTGMNWAGVLLNDSNYCEVLYNRFNDWIGTLQDRADITVYKNSNYNLIKGNICLGKGDHGIFIQDPYLSTYPTGNIVTENEVGEHESYGITIYVNAATVSYDSQTIISNNVIRDIKGSSLVGSASGAGIYVQSAGGVTVTGNKVSNCCRNTINFDTLAMAAISVTIAENGTGNSVPCIVGNNNITAQRGPGIWISTSDRSIVVEGNTIKSSGTSATGRGEGLIVTNSVAVKVHNNYIEHLNPNHSAMRISSITSDYSYHQITNNTILAKGGGGLTMNSIGGGTSSNCLVEGNTVWTGGVSTLCYAIEKSNYLRFANNHGESPAIVATFTNCLGVVMTGNRLTSSSGSYGIIFTGTNTGSVCNESNSLSGVIENDPGNGFLISQYGDSAPPMSGLWSVGDRVIKKTSASGSPVGWRCTGSGNPGIWTAEINLGSGGGGGSSGESMRNFFQNPYFDLYGANPPSSGPPVGVSGGSPFIIRNTSFVYDDNPTGVSMQILTSGTTIGHGATITPSAPQPWKGTTAVGITIPIYAVNPGEIWRVHAYNGTTYTLIGETTTTGAWTLIKGTYTPTSGANWSIVISCWDGSSYLSGKIGYVGGCSLVRGSVPAITIEDSLARRTYTVITAGAPTLSPDFTGERWYDTSSGKFYMAKGQTSGAADWIMLN